MEYLEQAEAQLQMLRPQEPGAVDALRGMQVGGPLRARSAPLGGWVGALLVTVTRRGTAQDELVAGGHMRAPPDAALAKAGAAKARKAARRGAPAKRAYRAFTSPAGLQARGARRPGSPHPAAVPGVPRRIGAARRCWSGGTRARTTS